MSGLQAFPIGAKSHEIRQGCEMRSESSAEGRLESTREFAEPHRFVYAPDQPGNRLSFVPSVSSERREFLPVGPCVNAERQ